MSVTAAAYKGRISHIFRLSFNPEMLENLDITERATETSLGYYIISKM